MYIIIPLNQPLHVDKQYHMTKPVSYCYHHGHEPLSMIECSKKNVAHFLILEGNVNYCYLYSLQHVCRFPVILYLTIRKNANHLKIINIGHCKWYSYCKV